MVAGSCLGLLLALCLGARPQAQQAATQTLLLAQIEAFDRKLVQAEATLLDGEAQARAISLEVAAAQTAKATADEAYKRTVAKLGRRLGALTRMGPGAEVTALWGVKDLSALVDQQQLMRQVARHDRTLWAAHRASGEQLQLCLALIQERAQVLESVQNQRKNARDELARMRGRKDRTLQALRRRHKHEIVGKELQLAQVRLSAVVAQTSGGDGELPSSGAYATHSRPRLGLPWPAAGRVRIAFGQHTEETFGTATFHNGWDIAAAAGSAVSAIASGVVAYADWLHGYGQVAIVEHPGGFHTVHGHLGRLLVAQGARVRAGDRLGTVGDTGSLRGTVLYFEVRHRGVPEDPKLYLRRRAS